MNYWEKYLKYKNKYLNAAFKSVQSDKIILSNESFLKPAERNDCNEDCAPNLIFLSMGYTINLTNPYRSLIPKYITINNLKMSNPIIINKGSYGSVYSYSKNNDFLAVKTFEDNEFTSNEQVEIIYDKQWIKGNIISFDQEELKYTVKANGLFLNKSFQEIRPDLLKKGAICLVKSIGKIGVIKDSKYSSTLYEVEFSDKSSKWYSDTDVFRSIDEEYPIATEYEKEKNIIQKLFSLPQMNIVPATYNDWYRVIIMKYIPTDLSKLIEIRTPIFYKNLINQISNTLLTLSKNGLFYTDIKGPNILFQNNNFYLADFGSINILNGDTFGEIVMSYPPFELKESEGIIYGVSKEQVLASMVWGVGVIIMNQISILRNFTAEIIYTKMKNLDQKKYDKFLKNIQDYNFDKELEFLKVILISCFQPVGKRISLEELAIFLKN